MVKILTSGLEVSRRVVLLTSLVFLLDFGDQIGHRVGRGGRNRFRSRFGRLLK